MQGGQVFNLEVAELKEALQAEVYVGGERLSTTVGGIYASDLMSDVLAYGQPGACLLTGLNSVHAAISSYMAEIEVIVLLRGKIPGPETRKFAEEKGIILLSTKAEMYDACIKIYNIGKEAPPAPVMVADTNGEAGESGNEDVTVHEFRIDGQDFASAGMVSTNIKTILKEIGYDLGLIRRIAISTYEAEMNVVMHALRAKVTLHAGDSKIRIIMDDEGKGIPDIEKAMCKGFTTATEEQRALGFGAGMGLPNIDKNSDKLGVTSEVGIGTRLEMEFLVN